MGTKLAVGTRVHITNGLDCYHDRTGRIISNDENDAYPYRVDFGGNDNYVYNESEFEVVEASTRPQVGDRVKVLIENSSHYGQEGRLDWDDKTYRPFRVVFAHDEDVEWFREGEIEAVPQEADLPVGTKVRIVACQADPDDVGAKGVIERVWYESATDRQPYKVVLTRHNGTTDHWWLGREDLEVITEDEPAPAPTLFAVGTKVRIHDEYCCTKNNGLEGTVVQVYGDDDPPGYEVQIEDAYYGIRQHYYTARHLTVVDEALLEQERAKQKVAIAVELAELGLALDRQGGIITNRREAYYEAKRFLDYEERQLETMLARLNELKAEYASLG